MWMSASQTMGVCFAFAEQQALCGFSLPKGAWFRYPEPEPVQSSWFLGFRVATEQSASTALAPKITPCVFFLMRLFGISCRLSVQSQINADGKGFRGGFSYDVEVVGFWALATLDLNGNMWYNTQ